MTSNIKQLNIPFMVVAERPPVGAGFEATHTFIVEPLPQDGRVPARSRLVGLTNAELGARERALGRVFRAHGLVHSVRQGWETVSTRPDGKIAEHSLVLDVVLRTGVTEAGKRSVQAIILELAPEVPIRYSEFNPLEIKP